jgi:hypothetical protein
MMRSVARETRTNLRNRLFLRRRITTNLREKGFSVNRKQTWCFLTFSGAPLSKGLEKVFLAVQRLMCCGFAVLQSKKG